MLSLPCRWYGGLRNVSSPVPWSLPPHIPLWFQHTMSGFAVLRSSFWLERMKNCFVCARWVRDPWVSLPLPVPAPLPTMVVAGVISRCQPRERVCGVQVCVLCFCRKDKTTVPSLRGCQKHPDTRKLALRENRRLGENEFRSRGSKRPAVNAGRWHSVPALGSLLHPIAVRKKGPEKRSTSAKNIWSLHHTELHDTSHNVRSQRQIDCPSGC